MVLEGTIHFHVSGRVNVNAPIWNSSGSAAQSALDVAKSKKKDRSFIVGCGSLEGWLAVLGRGLLLNLVLVTAPESAGLYLRCWVVQAAERWFLYLLLAGLLTGRHLPRLVHLLRQRSQRSYS